MISITAPEGEGVQGCCHEMVGVPLSGTVLAGAHIASAWGADGSCHCGRLQACSEQLAADGSASRA